MYASLVFTALFLNFRSFLVEQDWTQCCKREGTFVLDQPDNFTSNPPSARSNTSLPRPTQDSGPRSLSSRSRIPSACQRKPIQTELPHTNGSTSMAGEDLLAAINQVEESISPLARANCQIRESLVALEKNLMVLKTASANYPDMSAWIGCKCNGII